MYRHTLSALVLSSLPLLLLAGCGDDEPGTGGSGNEGGVGNQGGTGNQGAGGTGNQGTGGTGATGAGGTGNQGAGGNPGGGGAGGSCNVPNNDTCLFPESHSLAQGALVQTSGDTSCANDDYVSFCNDMDGAPDVVLALDVAQEGTLLVNVQPAAGSALDPAVYFRDTACNQDDACFTFGLSENIAKHVVADTYYFIIDGENGTAGGYDFTASLSAPVCGDGVLNPGEECDPGAPAPNDGCVDPGEIGECLADAADPNFDVCDGEAVAIGLGDMLIQSGSSTPYVADYDSLNCGFAAGGRDRVYAVTPTSNGLLTASIGLNLAGQTVCDIDINDPGCWDMTLYARTTCGDQASEITCSDIGYPNEETISFPVVSGLTYYIFIDGYDGQFYSHGPYNLFLELN